MYEAYMRIFQRLGLDFRAVAADTGSIGGSRSNEFQVIADTGEDLIVYNPDSQYAANIELAEAACLIPQREPATEDLFKAPTPSAPKCEIVAQQLNKPLSDTVKSIRSEEHTSELQSLMRISYALVSLNKKHKQKEQT